MSDKKINWLIGVIVLLLIIFLVWPMIFGKKETAPALSLEEAITLAGDWVETSSPTYLFDGSNLSLVNAEEAECLNPPCYKIEFSFESAMAGYGDRSDAMVDQVITSHNIVVFIEGGDVVEVVIDDVYTELERQEEYIFENSGLDENNEEVALLTNNRDVNIAQTAGVVSFSPSEYTSVKVFFSNSLNDPEASDCQKVYPVYRQVKNIPAIGRASMGELLSGPTAEEKTFGYFTNINPGVSINDLKIENGVAYIDFSGELLANVGGSCRTMAIEAQIKETLKQFSTVSEVIISVNGEIEGILQP